MPDIGIGWLPLAGKPEVSRYEIARFCKSVTIRRRGAAMVFADGEGTKVLLARGDDRGPGAGAGWSGALFAEAGPVAGRSAGARASAGACRRFRQGDHGRPAKGTRFEGCALI